MNELIPALDQLIFFCSVVHAIAISTHSDSHLPWSNIGDMSYMEGISLSHISSRTILTYYHLTEALIFFDYSKAFNCIAQSISQND